MFHRFAISGHVDQVVPFNRIGFQVEQRVVIPTVYRNNYLAALRALSRTRRAEPLIRAMDFAQRFTQRVPWSDIESTRIVLDQCNAFRDANEAENANLRLLIPDET